jgi:hypothetical protein
MGISRMGDKAVRRLSERTGLDLVKVCCWSDPSYAVGVDAQDRHYEIDRRTGEWTEEEPANHFSTCPLASSASPPATEPPDGMDEAELPRWRELRGQDRRIWEGVSSR